MARKRAEVPYKGDLAKPIRKFSNVDDLCAEPARRFLLLFEHYQRRRALSRW
jgi:hypothetical protein